MKKKKKGRESLTRNDHTAVVRTAHPAGQPVHGHLGYATVVYERRGDDQHVEDLVAVAPQVELARVEPLGHPPRVQERARDVQHGHEDQGADRSRGRGAEDALLAEVVAGGHDAREAKRDEHPRPQGPVLRLAELVPQRHDDGAEAQDGGDGEVDDLGEEGAVEAVVEPRDERAHDEEGDAAVVELAKELAHDFRVAGDGVEGEGHAEAEDGAGEEGGEDELLLDVDLDARAGEEVGGDGDEGEAADQVRPDVARLRVDPGNVENESSVNMHKTTQYPRLYLQHATFGQVTTP